MSKKNSETYYIVDHANKLADRERVNINRKQRRLLKTWDKESGKSTTVDVPDWREPTGEDSDPDQRTKSE